MKKYGNEFIDKQDFVIGALDWIDFISTKVPELGYEKIEPVIYGHFGSYAIGDYFSKKEEDENFKQIIGEKLFQKTIQKNKILKQERQLEMEKYKSNNSDLSL